MLVLLFEYITAYLNLFSNTPVFWKWNREWTDVFWVKRIFFLENYFKTWDSDILLQEIHIHSTLFKLRVWRVQEHGADDINIAHWGTSTYIVDLTGDLLKQHLLEPSYCYHYITLWNRLDASDHNTMFKASDAWIATNL